MMEAYWIWWHVVTRHMIRTLMERMSIITAFGMMNMLDVWYLKEAIFAINAFQVLG